MRTRSASAVLAPGSSGRSSRTCSAVQRSRSAPARPPPVTSTRTKRWPQPPNALPHVRSQTLASGSGPLLRSSIRSLPRSAKRRSSYESVSA